MTGVSGAKTGDSGDSWGEEDWGEGEVAVARSPKDKSREGG